MKRSIMNSKTLLTKAQYIQAVEKNSTRLAGKIFFMVSIFLLFFFASKAQKYNGHYFNNLNENGVILDGYDAVAFFTDNKPVKGEAKFQYSHEDAIYYFASQEHLDLFKANPDKYKP
ncbi:MAG: YHS domain-containing protein, partial [Bacteroidota bacterium]